MVQVFVGITTDGTVAGFTGQDETIDVELDWTVTQVIAVIRGPVGDTIAEWDTVSLYFAGKLLEGFRTLADYNVKREEFLYVRDFDPAAETSESTEPTEPAAAAQAPTSSLWGAWYTITAMVLLGLILLSAATSHGLLPSLPILSSLPLQRGEGSTGVGWKGAAETDA